MFPIVPLNFNTKSNPSDRVQLSDLTGSSKLLVPGRVISSTYISHGALSMPIEARNLRGDPPVVQLSVQCNNFETIELENESKDVWDDDVHWVRAIRLSEDCHNYNIQLRMLPHQRPSFYKADGVSKLVLQTVRPIEAGQELLLWFSEDILAKLQMVFLSPLNIQGQRKYVCNRCSAMYESPNPLKLHMTLACGRFTISDIWEKLAFALTDQLVMEHESKETFKFKLVAADSVPNSQNNAIDLSKPPKTNSEDAVVKTERSGPLVESSARNSAFKPVAKSEKGAKNNVPLLPPPIHQYPNYFQWPVLRLAPDFQTNLSVQEKVDDKAHIETLVSSLGKSKEGHVCLYCGKCYSRKYGLKIHIRTHTGYKPLKCKYCLRPFGDPSNLNKHTRLHAEGDTPYKCELCGKVLVRRRDLERHLKSRHMNEINPDSSTPDDISKNDALVADEDEEQILSVD